jgi:hypothetical protein
MEEGFLGFCVVCQLQTKVPDCYCAVEARVMGLVDHTYALFSKFLKDFIVRDGRPSHDDPLLMGQGNINWQTATVLW